MDITPAVMVFTPLNEDLVAKLNSIGACEKSDWEIGKGFSTTVDCEDDFRGKDGGNQSGETSQSGSGSQQNTQSGSGSQQNSGGDDSHNGPKVGTTYYTAVKSGSSTDEVYLSKDSETFNGESPAKRSTDFSEPEILTRIK